MEEALNWWNNLLTNEGRDLFPIPSSNNDILDYFNNVAEFTLPPNINY